MYKKAFIILNVHNTSATHGYLINIKCNLLVEDQRRNLYDIIAKFCKSIL